MAWFSDGWLTVQKWSADPTVNFDFALVEAYVEYLLVTAWVNVSSLFFI